MKPKIEDIGMYFLINLLKSLFLVGAGLFFALVISEFINVDIISKLNAKIHPVTQIIYAELLGFVSPGPRYIIYPIIAKLKEFGVETAVIIALIGGHVLIEPSTTFVEVGFFGWRFPVKRFIASFIVTFLAGFVTIYLWRYFQ